MAFYVNEDRPDNAATVHRTGGSCKVPRIKLERDGGWYGPFDNKAEALRVACETGRLSKRECSICIGQSWEVTTHK